MKWTHAVMCGVVMFGAADMAAAQGGYPNHVVRIIVPFTPGGIVDNIARVVGEQLQGRVDRSGAGLPGAAGALADLADDLVAVHRLLGEDREHGGAHISAAD